MPPGMFPPAIVKYDASSVPVLSVDEERWEDNRMNFRVRALGQAQEQRCARV